MIKFSVITNTAINFRVALNQFSFETEVGRVVYLDRPWYEGEYTVIPTLKAQVLATAKKAMTDDVTIAEIPVFEVSNLTGTTLIIGE